MVILFLENRLYILSLTLFDKKLCENFPRLFEDFISFILSWISMEIRYRVGNFPIDHSREGFLSNFPRVELLYAWQRRNFRGIRRRTEAGIRCKYSRETLGWLWPSLCKGGSAARGLIAASRVAFFAGHHACEQIWRRLTTFPPLRSLPPFSSQVFDGSGYIRFQKIPSSSSSSSSSLSWDIFRFHCFHFESCRTKEVTFKIFHPRIFENRLENPP